MRASLGIKVNNSVIQELIVVKAAEVMLSQLHHIKLPSKRIHTPHVLHQSQQPEDRLVADALCIQAACKIPSLLFWQTHEGWSGSGAEQLGVVHNVMLFVVSIKFFQQVTSQQQLSDVM